MISQILKTSTAMGRRLPAKCKWIIIECKYTKKNLPQKETDIANVSVCGFDASKCTGGNYQ